MSSSRDDDIPSVTYYRCRHCRGFYETTLSRCAWCEYDAPAAGRGGRPKVFPDRATCRAVQIAEYEQLSAEAHADPMGPPKEALSLRCACLQCGERGHEFEAVEMRWLANEGMWACPCTTCGGRGFGVDVHTTEPRWECARCGHFYAPAGGDFKAANAKCPRCGSTEANGWFDDEDDEDESDEAWDEGLDDALDLDGAQPWEDAGSLCDEEGQYDGPWRHWRGGAGDAGDAGGGAAWAERDGRIPDDIDHPRDFPRRGRHDDRHDGDDFNEDDIPF